MDEELLKLQDQIRSIIKEANYGENTFLMFNNTEPATVERLVKINEIFFNFLREKGHDDIDDFLREIEPTLVKINRHAFDNKFTERQMIKFLHIKYLAVISYLSLGDLNEKIERKKIIEIIESFSIQ